MSDFVVLLLGSTLASAAPLILAGLGEMFLERSGGGFNLGIEGILLCGALAGVLGSYAGGPGLGLTAGAVAGLMWGAIFAISAAIGIDTVLIGIAITIGGTGISTFFSQVVAPSGQRNITAPLLPAFPVPGLAELPVLGQPLGAVSAGVWLSVAVAGLSAWVLRRTRYGLRLRAAAEASTAVVKGIDVGRYRASAAMIAGALTGSAGAVLAIGSIGTFTPLMSGGRGFLVLAVVIIGGRKPAGVVAGAVLFACLDGLALMAQTRDLGLPSEAYHCFPYVAALAVLCGRARWHTVRPVTGAIRRT
ncbi:ABC transporter permease [Amycolatopsis sp. CA-230715]|uniref:ABC transporter permease n=1 Tax=Amycolatopsis sp. CA-230715 TaxID=2745196 RepID=UPI001C01901D|nr:ABC transporter permease [Amycolatopsis sp. CA-230715]QWF85855.1 hypothetical protein HUW46_09335 [Amycolatopsis sp. CA-230715]